MTAARAIGLLLALGSVGSGGCARNKASKHPEPPAEARKLHEGSDLVIEADAVLAAFASGLVAPLHESMTPDLAGRVRLGDLEVASQHLRDVFGAPSGIMEEKVHREGDLLWYSGLVVHELPPDPEADADSAERRGVLTPVLYQFALTGDRKVARLLVREHWFWSAVKHPAEYYVSVNRFFVPGRGDWTVSHGGRTRATNKHHGSRGQRYAYDLVVKKKGRARPGGSAKRNESFYCHGQPLLAPASGTVVLVVDGVAENAVGERGKAGGNGVRIDHGFGEISSLWHAIPGSIRVKEGDQVEAGQVIGLVGNSGRSSGPHIHVDVFYEKGEYALPMEFVDTYVDDRWQDRVLPVRGEVVRSWPSDKDTKRKRTAAGPVVFVAG